MAEALFDLEAERALLSLALNAPHLRASLFASVKEDAFYVPIFRRLWREAALLFERGEDAGYYEVARRVPMGTRDEELVAGLRSLYTQVENWQFWAERVNGFSHVRKLRQHCRQWYNALEKPVDGGLPDIDGVLAKIGRTLADLTAPAARQLVFAPKEWSEIVKSTVDYRRGKNIGEFTLPLGLGSLDEDLAVEAGDLVMVKGKSGRGKTSFTVHSSAHVGIELLRPVFYANTEMAVEQIGIRFYAWVSGVDSNRIRLGLVNDEEMKQIREAQERLAASKLILSDALKGQDMAGIVSLARMYKAQDDIELLVVDHAQRTSVGSGEREYQELQRAAQMLKELATELKIVVLLVAQMTEEGYIAGSKRMKWECDAVLELHDLNPEKEEDRKWQEWGATGWLVVEKARNAPDGQKRGVIRDAATNRWTVLGTNTRIGHSSSRWKKP